MPQPHSSQPGFNINTRLLGTHLIFLYSLHQHLQCWLYGCNSLKKITAFSINNTFYQFLKLWGKKVQQNVCNFFLKCHVRIFFCVFLRKKSHSRLNHIVPFIFNVA
ncbi:hypothetical protein XELAEV_18016941mg [Xenopus laevis]|uniref:Uncharacterized protein n=1 Tax=Xenopus laevis TaxID=8355 RepID=A0A974HRX8_XENLA|nr:hypothetical protein XELAEV_18016941mg [Xenopus laevis]